MKKKILFLGYVVTPEEANIASGASVAGNKMQWNVIKNLSQIRDVEIDCVTVPPRAAFPHDKKVFCKSEKVEIIKNVMSYRISFCNLPVIKQFWQIITTYKTAKRLITEKNIDVVLCFNLFPQIGVPMRWIKNRFRQLETVCLLADLPIDDNTKRKGLSSWLRSLMEKSTWKSMEVCDKYIVLNKHVIEKYLPNKPYVVVEGGVSDENIKKYDIPVKKGEEKNILYCGALTEYNGVLNLIQAMDLLDDTDIILDIYGDGYLRKEVEDAAEKNCRIRYFGRISNEEVMKKQKEAWLLINPRIVDDPIAQVTFPSKTFEYLLSGTPVLTTKLNGYDEEYLENMYISENDSSSAISDAVRKISTFSKEDLNKKAEAAKVFAKEKKNWKVQTMKIEQFIGGNDVSERKK